MLSPPTCGFLSFLIPSLSSPGCEIACSPWAYPSVKALSRPFLAFSASTSPQATYSSLSSKWYSWSSCSALYTASSSSLFFSLYSGQAHARAAQREQTKQPNWAKVATQPSTPPPQTVDITSCLVAISLSRLRVILSAIR